MRKVDFVFFDAGGGHRSAATALKAAAEEQGRPWEIRLVNLQEVLESLDMFRKLTGIRLQDMYNRMLAAGWTLGSQYLLAGMHGLIRLCHPAQVRMLADFWRSQPPDLLISLVPNFNRALFQGLRYVSDATPFVTILTDFADYPPHFWIERQDQYFICGTERAVQQAREMGHPSGKIFLVSGMILRPAFYREYTHDRGAERVRIGLDPGRPTGLVLFGGHGSPDMLTIASELHGANTDIQLIMICGRNEKLAVSLRDLRTRFPTFVSGFTTDIPYYMSLSDFFMGKPGPGSISEALAMGLPVIIQKNAWTLPQERYNADWVLSNGVGIVLPDFGKVSGAVSELLAGNTLQQFRNNVRQHRNRAVYEIPEILSRLT